MVVQHNIHINQAPTGPASTSMHNAHNLQELQWGTVNTKAIDSFSSF